MKKQREREPGCHERVVDGRLDETFFGEEPARCPALRL
jgi:hypothetical protein